MFASGGELEGREDVLRLQRNKAGLVKRLRKRSVHGAGSRWDEAGSNSSGRAYGDEGQRVGTQGSIGW